MNPPRNVHARAALLMLGSTLGFGLMAIFIRLASKTIPTWEVAFFRNAFGFLTLLPMLVLRLHGTEIERPLAVVMTGGLVTSTAFTLLALPTFYLWWVGRE